MWIVNLWYIQFYPPNWVEHWFKQYQTHNKRYNAQDSYVKNENDPNCSVEDDKTVFTVTATKSSHKDPQKPICDCNQNKDVHFQDIWIIYAQTSLIIHSQFLSYNKFLTLAIKDLFCREKTFPQILCNKNRWNINFILIVYSIFQKEYFQTPYSSLDNEVKKKLNKFLLGDMSINQQ